MNTKSIADVAEQIVQDTALALLLPQAGECLACYVLRQANSFGCNHTHRFARTFRDLTAPRATALGERLARMGACHCDCEIFTKVYGLVHTYYCDDFASKLPCAGVRRGSTQPCALWARYVSYY
ncbi:DUF2695 domain-containing protein [Leucobacter sp. HY1910]